MSLRALTLVDVLAQLQEDSGGEVAYDASEVINTLIADTETLAFTNETWTVPVVTNYPYNIIQDASPVGYWRLDDPLPSTVAFDSSPTGSSAWPKLPASVSGAVTFQVAGAMTGSKGATLNGSSGFLEVPNVAALQRVADLTIEAWIKMASLSAASVLISKGTAGEFHVIVNTDGSISLRQGPSYNTVILPASSITVGPWFHVVIVRRAIDKSINTYLNGTSTFTGTYTTTPSTTTNVLRIGATSPTAASWFNGTLDEVALYARPLTATQVAHHYAWGTAATVGSVPYGTGRYGLIGYPIPGPITGAIYGDATTTYGAATYA